MVSILGKKILKTGRTSPFSKVTKNPIIKNNFDSFAEDSKRNKILPYWFYLLNSS
jgi:hypothetical protein